MDEDTEVFEDGVTALRTSPPEAPRALLLGENITELIAEAVAAERERADDLENQLSIVKQQLAAAMELVRESNRDVAAERNQFPQQQKNESPAE